MKSIRNIPLSLQIWGLCTGVTLCVFILIMIFLPVMMNEFFTRQVYALLEDSQKTVEFIEVITGKKYIDNSGTYALSISAKDSASIETTEVKSGVIIAQGMQPVMVKKEKSNQSSEAVQSEETLDEYNVLVNNMAVEPKDNSSGLPPVNHLLISLDYPNEDLPYALPDSFLKAIKTEAFQQTRQVQRYSHREGNNTLLYVIRKQPIDGSPFHLVTYAWSSYTRELSANLMKQLFWLMIALCLLSGLPALLLARRLTKPLVEMEIAASCIAEHDWQQPLVSERRDEIGRLTRSFDKMREHLARQDEAQQSFLQNLSHELKTPAMVISSYARAILDGIYPRDNLEESVQVILNESQRLQKRIQDFLYLNKLKYLALHKADMDHLYLDSLVEDVVERLRWERPDLNWVLELDTASIKGEPQQLAIALENLLDNQMRYAAGQVRITLKLMPSNETDRVCLRVFNDGSPIEADLLEHLFDPYASGRKGQFGLGMAIFKQIMDMHEAQIYVSNEEQGVVFHIEF